MSRTPVPGEAQLDPRARTIALVRNVTLGTLIIEQHLDAMIDTGATHCIVPPSTARALGFEPSNRIGREQTNTVGGQVEMDIHWLEYLKVGSAKAYRVTCGVHTTVPGTRFLIVGLSFIRRFRTTFDFSGSRVLFRSTSSPGP
jgi:predicted aspartyl protease